MITGETEAIFDAPPFSERRAKAKCSISIARSNAEAAAEQISISFVGNTVGMASVVLFSEKSGDANADVQNIKQADSAKMITRMLFLGFIYNAPMIKVSLL